jgi:hypothetical protein
MMQLIDSSDGLSFCLSSIRDEKTLAQELRDETIKGGLERPRFIFPEHLYYSCRILIEAVGGSCTKFTVDSERRYGCRMTKLIHDGSCSSEKNAVAGEILSYLANHPQASDTLEGIVDWWLLRQKIEYQTKVVRDALADLVEKGFLVKEVTKDSRIRYRANEKTDRVL